MTGRAPSTRASRCTSCCPHASYRSVRRPRRRGPFPACRIEDAPRFSWRGLHLDVARHFFPKREVLRLVDLMAVHKLNRLHLHLVDDQGWRVESRAYPRLHEVASHRPRTATNYYREHRRLRRGPARRLLHARRPGRDRRLRPRPGRHDRAGDRRAGARLGDPGRLPGARRPPGEPDYQVLERWGISPAILSPLPPTVEFLTTIFDEMLGALGETPYVHIGGDEVRARPLGLLPRDRRLPRVARAWRP